MPHQIIEYSANLEADADVAGLVRTLHETAAGIDALPIGGLRTRAARRDLYLIADGHPDNVFVNVTLRIAKGRSLEVRQAAGSALFDALCAYLEPVMAKRPVALSYEITEIEPDTRWKKSNIRDYLAKRAGQ